MPKAKTAAIEETLIETLRSKAGHEAESEKLIQIAREQSHGVDEWEVRKALWRLTADGRADFTPGFKKVLLRAA